ncbi:MAG: hypothetical protein KAY37_15945 [Phycisphaerae bacterium]|nr:hypothetical protein [Phycisphaerae bacterium]
MKTLLSGLLLFSTLCLFLMPLGGCPTGLDDLSGITDGIGTSTLPVTKTSIPVRYETSLEVGNDLIVFGTGALTGVSYVIPSQNPTTETAIVGDYHSSGFGVAGKKVLLFESTFQLTVYDTATDTATAVSTDDIYLDTLPDRDNEDIKSPVVVDGNLAVTRNNPDRVGNALKVIDVSGATPLITPLNNLPDDLPISGRQIALDATDMKVITFADNSFFVYDLNNTSAAPREIDLSEKMGIRGPFRYDHGSIIYVAASHPLENVKRLDLADDTETPGSLSKNPGHRDMALAFVGGTFAYFLNRNANDTHTPTPTATNVYRSAIGEAPAFDAVEGGNAGEDPDENVPPWEGYGRDVALAADGDYIFISGDEGLDVTTEYLQVSSGSVFLAFADGSGYLNASDVDANATLVGFKIGEGEDTTLGYIILP